MITQTSYIVISFGISVFLTQNIVNLKICAKILMENALAYLRPGAKIYRCIVSKFASFITFLIYLWSICRFFYKFRLIFFID